MKHVHYLLFLCLLAGCSGLNHHANEKPKTDARTISTKGSRSNIEIKDARVTWEMIEGIIAARNGKNRNDRWEVSLKENGDVMIWKFRKDGGSYPPGAAIEFWYIGTDGEWRGRFTA